MIGVRTRLLRFAVHRFNHYTTRTTPTYTEWTEIIGQSHRSHVYRDTLYIISSLVNISQLVSSSLSSRTDCMEFLNFLSFSLSLFLSLYLSIHPYHQSLQAGLLCSILGPHRVDVCKSWLAGLATLVCPCVGVHEKTLLMSSSWLLQQCPACLVRLHS